ncbi:MAG TPA: hypothetical protein VM253_09515 [Candidatus Limnocylindrales bacterium]|jgi:hypothetical protein|nr:hypothetical protein [Candidatus Limnocylindrales bacterium]
MADDHDPMPRHDEEDETERESARAELGGAYGEDDTPVPTETAETLGNPPRGEARYETKFEDGETDADADADR